LQIDRVFALAFTILYNLLHCVKFDLRKQ